jgi:hypothetical protein
MKKIGKGILWFFSVIFLFGGIIGLTQGDWVGILVFLTGLSMFPMLQKWIPIKTWQQAVAGVILFCVAVAAMPTANNSQDTLSPTGSSTQLVSELPESQSSDIDRVFTVKFTTGDEYAGKLNGDQSIGEGTFTYTDVGTYEGTFNSGKRNGTGTFTWKNGDVYVGDWGNDRITGDGVLTFQNGTVLTASFVDNNVISGDYKWKDQNGDYILHVDNTNKEPIYTIKVTYVNDVTYEGEFASGNLNGQGNMTYPEIGSYTGGFLDGKKNGEGQFVWKDGDHFSGVWKDDQMSGQGLYTFADGSTLSGNFAENVPSGTLIYTYKGTQYNTVWEKGACKKITKA